VLTGIASEGFYSAGDWLWQHLIAKQSLQKGRECTVKGKHGALDRH